VDIKVFILTVAENSGICKFSGIYFIEFEKKTKSAEITLLARTLAISFTIYKIRFLCFTNIIYSPFYFQKRTISFFLIIFHTITDCTCIIISKFTILYLRLKPLVVVSQD
jgi:hypothetical protein